MTAFDESRFAHLHVHSEYSLYSGVARIKELVAKAKELGMKHLAITDYGALYGVIPFYKECKEQGIKPIIGCELYVAPASRYDRCAVDGVTYYNLILLAENQTGYKNLVKLVSLANIEGMYHKPRVDKELLQKYHEGLICLSSGADGEVYRAISSNNKPRAEKVVQKYIDIFGRENFFIEIQNHGLSKENSVTEGLVELANSFGLGLVAANDCRYICRDDCKLYAVLQCIEKSIEMDEFRSGGYDNGEYYLKSPQEMAVFFSEYPEAIINTVRIAERCHVDFDFGQSYVPVFPIPQNCSNDDEYLCELCEKALPAYYSDITDEIWGRLYYELDMIKRRGFARYFLIAKDIVEFCQEHKINVGTGCSSLLGSIAAYVLGINKIDPLKYNLAAESVWHTAHMFLPEFYLAYNQHQDNRDVVINYLKERYGYDSVAQIAVLGTMTAKGIFRDVGKALGMDYEQANDIAETIPSELGITLDEALKTCVDFRRYYESSEVIRQWIDLARGLEGLPRHASTHAAMVVVAPGSLMNYLPISESEESLVAEFPVEDLEELGMLMVSLTPLRTLTVINDTLENIECNCGVKLDINNIPSADELTAKLLCEGQTGALFCLDNPARISVIKELTPKTFADLIRKDVLLSLRISSIADAVLIWQSAYLKAHYPKEYMTAALNSVLDNKSKLAAYLDVAKRMGLEKGWATAALHR
ncbi:DNA polymerase III subunit alpha [Selenomonas sp. AE3005]|uniref:DNA polymerase III subunit alpha n=1 Tax=Selenomonas sp. AE3005 TaxID=1485543 RepID=UPI000690DCD5|nr:DNA polymerase III subunit alpha [Selenomonas sp. AE3005]